MKANPVGAPYTPFMDPRTTHAPGLSPLDPAEWVVTDADYAAQMAERDALVTGEPEVVIAATPDSGPALAEFRAALLAHLARDGRWRVGRDAVMRPDEAEIPLALDTLPLAGRLCQEDFCLMAPQGPGEEYRLIAGVLCFPSRWMLTEKLDRPLTSIHGPVPKYAEALAPRVNRVFEAIRPERPMVRVNWVVWPIDTLHVPRSERGKAAPAPLSGRFWLRTERQTLVRLPETRTVVFGIKTTVTPLEAMTAGQRAALRAALAAKPADMVAYSGGPAQHAAALAALA